METEKPQKQLSDLVRWTEVVSGGHPNMTATQTFSVVESLKTDNYLRLLNAGRHQDREYLEVAHLKLENIEWREWYDNGFIEGLQFKWSNGS